MTIQFRVPHVDDSQIRVIRHAEFLFQGKGPTQVMDRMVLENLIRVVVHAALEYRRGAEAILRFYATLWPEEKQVWPEQWQLWPDDNKPESQRKQQLSVAATAMPDIGIMLGASSNFETSITSVHRALLFLQKIRKQKKLLSNEKANLPKYLPIYRDCVRDSVKDFRNAIHHNEEDITSEDITTGTSFIPYPVFEEMHENGRCDWGIQRIELGKHSILFRDLARWITQLRACAEALSEAAYDKPPAAVSAQT